MDPLKLIRQVDQNHDRQEGEFLRQQEAALAAFRKWPAKRQSDFLKLALDHFQTVAQGEQLGHGSSANSINTADTLVVGALRTPVRERRSYVDLAERFVREHVEGSTSNEVATAIGQPAANAHQTLRHLSRTRGTVEQREGKWFSVEGGIGKKQTIRDVIAAVLVNESALETTAIVAAARDLDRTINEGSVVSEIQRMRRDGLVLRTGAGLRGNLYALNRPSVEDPTK